MKMLQIGFDEDVVAEIDARRGLIPRVAYIRQLVAKGLDVQDLLRQPNPYLTGGREVAERVAATALTIHPPLTDGHGNPKTLAPSLVPFGSRLKKK